MYAVLDLGSNSFHLVIAEQCDGALTPLKKVNHKVQLSEGTAATGKLSKPALNRAFDALELFQRELMEHPIERFCVVGTSALREAGNAHKFLQRANRMGFPVNVISGEMEAHYIYQGIQAGLKDSKKRRLIFDIGGGSTEFAVGNKNYADHLDSLNIGCVASRNFSVECNITPKLINKMKSKVLKNLEQNLCPKLEVANWKEVYASSGTAKMLSNILHANDFSDGTITADGLKQLELLAIDLKTPFRLGHIEGLKATRRNVFVTGLVIMQSIFDYLDLEEAHYRDEALREGILANLVKNERKMSLFTTGAPLVCRI